MAININGCRRIVICEICELNTVNEENSLYIDNVLCFYCKVCLQKFYDELENNDGRISDRLNKKYYIKGGK